MGITIATMERFPYSVGMTNPDSSLAAIPVWTLGDRLRKARQHANVSADQMAADIGRTVHTISNYERDATRAPMLVVRQYAIRTGVPFEWLQNGVNPVIAPDTSGYPAKRYGRAA